MNAHSYIRGFIGKIVLIFLFGGIFFVFLYQATIVPPATFPNGYHLTIEHGQSLFSISHELEDAGVIKSPRVFEMLMLTLGTDKTVSEGEYYFEYPVTVIGVALRISGRQFGIARKKVTFPEGFTTLDMANRLTETFPNFDTEGFVTLTKDDEGYLFPDTYGFFNSVKPEIVIAALKNNFTTKVGPLDAAIAASGHSQRDIVIMASIIEKEANGPEDRAMVAGILWKRIAIGMPLQVDAPFLFLIGKESKDLTKSDLAMKSAYNTYTNKGLPPGPINNPGLDSINAAITPTSSPYLYYLHDSTGAIHYARTFAEHSKNIKQYLK